MKQQLLNNLEWFYRSGVMIPENGLWGVAERVVLTGNNEAIQRMLEAFPAWTIHEDYCIIEQRRADCNFETAYLFLQAWRVLGEERFRETALNILDFLYFRSGLLWRKSTGCVPGSWNWSHIKRGSFVWFDDESWCIFLQLEIAREFPELDAKYQLKHWALILARELAPALERAMAPGEEALKDDGHWRDEKFIGPADQPHWGSLPCMALAAAFAEEPDPAFLKPVRAYHEYLMRNAERFDVSEVCYVIIGSAACTRFTGEALYSDVLRRFAQLLCAKIGENGNIPAEHHEAPCGPLLVDTIYTVNWAALGLQVLKNMDKAYLAPFTKVLDLLCRIQDKSPEAWLNGCWRGMFNMETGTWGGGDRYEGGAGSIYTGWTNAPIATVLALELQGRDLFSR